MAEQQVATFSSKPVSAKQKEKDFEAHAGTFAAFMSMTKWSIIGLTILLIAMYVFLIA